MRETFFFYAMILVKLWESKLRYDGISGIGVYYLLFKVESKGDH